jgi:hypothetical protein
MAITIAISYRRREAQSAKMVAVVNKQIACLENFACRDCLGHGSNKLLMSPGSALPAQCSDSISDGAPQPRTRSAIAHRQSEAWN